MNHSRLGDAPAPFRWVVLAIKEVGFPIVICGWLLYQQSVVGKETVKAIQEFKEVMLSVKGTLDQQNRILSRGNRDR